MIIDFDAVGADRKKLVAAVSEFTGEKAVYQFVPSCAYEIGGYTVDRSGNLICEDSADKNEVESLIEFLAQQGFTPKPLPLVENPGEGNEQPSDEILPDETIGFTVELPTSSFDETTLANLENLIKAKGNLIKKALDVDELTIEMNEEKIAFPWFNIKPGDSDAIRAYSHFIQALCEMARNQKRISSREKAVDNEKYAFRCFLLRLGFIGVAYKTERKVLLWNLSGSSSFKKGGKNEISR